jgi:ATPase subunit of ABC transporter with duplicated ATPase domains
MISVSGLAKWFGDHTLFRDASFLLNAGERYGLVGANGSGKTTLLGILTGDIDPSAGSVQVPARANLGVLRQDQFLYEEQEILGVAMMGNPELWQALVEKEKVLARAHEHFDAERYARLEDTILRHDGYAAEARAAEILEGLGLPAEVHRRPLSTLSGGFKLRVLLAQVLAGSPDALLLDEPTNHLDILSIRWLERFLVDFAGPVVVISHDHRFLDNVATHILDVDYETITLYHGDYSAFMEGKAAERERREKEIEGREKEIAHHQKFVDRFRAKASKARQAQSKLRLIEKKADALEPLAPCSRRYPNFRFPQKRPSGREVLKLEGITKAYGDNEVLHGVDLLVRRGDRLAIMGPNGIGKSTLLKIAVGELRPDAGSVEWGYETQPGYFAQDHHETIEEQSGTAEGWVMSHSPAKTIGQVRAELGRVLFSGEDAEKRLGALSGGEAARLVFCRLSIDRPNVLVLDEPTNHLDLEAIEALVEALRAYEGTLILVSHDRWFVSQLATRVVEIKPGEIVDYLGTYDEYVHFSGDDHLDVDRVVLKAKKEKSKGDGGPATPEAGNGGRGSRGKKKDGDRHAAGGRGASTSGAGSDRGGTRGSNGAVATGTRRSSKELAALRERRDEITARIEEAETRVAKIEAAFADPLTYEGTRTEELRGMEEERAALRASAEALMEEWAEIEEALGEG